MKLIHPTPLALVAAAAALTACGPGSVEDRTTELEAGASTDSGATAEPAEAESPEEATSAEVELGGTYEYPDGLTVELSGVERAVSGEWAAPESTPYARFTLQIQNGTDAPVDLSLLFVECMVGEDGRVGESVYDTDAGVDDGFTSTVMAGRNATADMGCVLAEDETYLQIEVVVQDDLASEEIVEPRPGIFFVGDVE